MPKPVLPIEEQIALLQSRGMKFRDSEAAKHYLLNISYYRLKGYWWDRQVDKVSHQFHPDVIFEDIIDSYNFDRHLRLLLFDGIERIEIGMRTKMIYFLSLSYGPFWYRNTELFRSESAHEENIQALEREFGYSKEIFIKDHKERFPGQDPEAWKIIEVISMGTLSKYFNNLHHQLPEKAKITQSMGLNIHKELASWLEAVTYFRNMVAHHSRLYSRLMVLKPKPVLNNPQLPWLLGDLRPLEINRPFLIISVILYLCNVVTPGHHIKRK